VHEKKNLCEVAHNSVRSTSAIIRGGIRIGGPHGSLPVREDDRSRKFRNTITYGDGCGSSLAELRPRTNCRRTDRSLEALAGLTGLAHQPATLNLHDSALQLTLQAFGAPKCIGSVFF
jgi:hypothetical protein